MSLISWPDGLHGGPRLLGTTDDPEVVAFVRERLTAQRRADLVRLEGRPRLRAVPDPVPKDGPDGDGP